VRPTPKAQALAEFYVSFDGTGVPIVSRELRGHKAKQPDGSAKTREVKLGCVFTQHGQDERGHPVRDPDSTTYVASFQTASELPREPSRVDALRNLSPGGLLHRFGRGGRAVEVLGHALDRGGGLPCPGLALLGAQWTIRCVLVRFRPPVGLRNSPRLENGEHFCPTPLG
jgi:hypothetical protein